MRAVLCGDPSPGRDELRQVVLNTGLECGSEDCVAFGKLLPRLVLGNFDVVLVDVGANPKAGLEAINAASRKAAVPVLAIGAGDDANVVLQALKSGARHFLDRSKPRDELIVAMEKLHRVDKVSYRRGKTIAVTAAVPGAGVTTVSSGLAFALAEKHPRLVALAELGTDVPELALNLDLQPTHTLSQVMRDWDRIDGSTLRQAMFDHPAGVQILVDPPGEPHPVAIESAPCKQLIALFKSLYDYTVVDLGHGAIGPAAHQVLAMAEAVVIVIRLDVPSLRLTKMYLAKLEQLGVTEEAIFLVANRYGQRRQLPWRKAEETLGLPVRDWLPDDPGTLNSALNHGSPLVQTARRARITRRFDQMAKSLNGAAAKTQ
jgi:pilus assembly protein CpaE